MKLLNTTKTYLVLLLTTVSSNAFAANDIEYYLDRFGTLAFRGIAFVLLLMFVWGIFMCVVTVKKIPKLRQQSGDPEAKEKAVLSGIAGVCALGLPLIIIAVVFSFFGAGAVQLVLPSDVDAGTAGFEDLMGS